MNEFTEITDEELEALRAELEQVWADPQQRHKLVVLPPTTHKVAILRDNCDGFGCPETPNHECGETLLVTTDLEGAQRAKEAYDLHTGEAHLEIVETKPFGWQPVQMVEAETCIDVKTGLVHETDQWEWLDFEDPKEEPVKVTWHWQVASVKSLFFLANRADAMEAHKQAVKRVCDAISEVVASENAPTNGPDMAVRLEDVEGLPEFE